MELAHTERIAYLEEKLEAQQLMLEITSDYMKKARADLQKANKHLTDSIHAAKRIQETLIPSDERLQEVFPGAFSLYLPKDELSGDMFWVSRVGDHRLAAAIDCAGHGVSGAMLTVLVVTLLNQIMASNIGMVEPALILDQLNRMLSQHTHNEQSRRQIRDGADIALIAYHPPSHTLQYAGAKRPLYLLRQGVVECIKPTRLSMGDFSDYDERTTLKNHVIPLQANDWVYLCSDGYHDQFGGPQQFKLMQRRFRHLLAGMAQSYPNGKDQCDGLLKYFQDWKAGRTQIDDVLVMGIPFS
ncbi:MAG: PP2C family protein-serine/threonine phosphatase [Bernardetiaceae bacterium]